MPFYVNTNIASLTAQMNLTNTQSSLSTSLQRLSSGLRINSAKDDAAGLAISQRMSALIGGLNQAQRNANDGISLAQTAEGALGTIGTNLQTLLTLAVQSSNSTNTSIDRAAIQTQASQILAQIDQTAATTQFNGANLLDGTFQNMAFQIGADVGQTTSISISSARTSNLGSTQTASLTASNSGAALSQGDLTINGVTVGPSLATYDNASYMNNADSAIAKVAAINAVSTQTGVTAQVNTTVETGGQQTAASSSGYLTINGVNTATITTSGNASADRLAVVNAINAVSGKSGVTAVDTGLAATGIELQAADGRNITYSFNGGLTGSTTGLTNISGGTLNTAGAINSLNGVNGVSGVTAFNMLAGATAKNIKYGSTLSASITATTALNQTAGKSLHFNVNGVSLAYVFTGTTADSRNVAALVNGNTTLQSYGITATVNAHKGIDLKSTKDVISYHYVSGSGSMGNLGLQGGTTAATTIKSTNGYIAGKTLGATAITKGKTLSFSIAGVAITVTGTGVQSADETLALAYINASTTLAAKGITAVKGTTGGIDIVQAGHYDSSVKVTKNSGALTLSAIGLQQGGTSAEYQHFTINNVTVNVHLTASTLSTNRSLIQASINANTSLSSLGIKASTNANGGLDLTSTVGGISVTGGTNELLGTTSGKVGTSGSVFKITIDNHSISVTLKGTLTTDVKHAVSLINANTTLQALGITAAVAGNGGINLSSYKSYVKGSGAAGELLGMTSGVVGGGSSVYSINVNGHAISVTMTSTAVSTNAKHAVSLINAQTAATGVAASYSTTYHKINLTSTSSAGVTITGTNGVQLNSLGLSTTSSVFNHGTAGHTVNFNINGTAVAVSLTGVYTNDLTKAKNAINTLSTTTHVSATIANGTLKLTNSSLNGVAITSTATAGASVGNIGLQVGTSVAKTNTNVSFSINGQAITYVMTGNQATDLANAAAKINSYTYLTGVSASSGYAGIKLSSVNGAAINLTGGTGTASLGNIGITKTNGTTQAASSPITSYGTYSLSSNNAITIGGGTGIADSGLIAGSYTPQTAYASTASGSATAFATGDFSINGILVGASQATSDTSSTSGNAASAIAKSAAINAISSKTGVTAKVNATTVTGANQNSTASGTGSVTINGFTTGAITVSGTNATSDRLAVITAINAISGQTGVVATDGGSSANGITLTAADGRNVAVSMSASSGTFSSANTGLNATGTSTTHYGTFTLSSAAQFTVAEGTNNVNLAGEGMLAAGTYGSGKTGGALSALDLSTAQGATNAITAINNAINSVNTIRANLGAVQNRFTNVITSLQNTTTNLSAANSRIMDADFAAETANLSRSQILQQAGTAMLAQANQLPSAVLSLLK